MNIGVFSGSFNPIHIGHLILGDYITQFTDIDEVWFVLSPQNPLKENSDLLEENERLKMVELAVADYPSLKVCSIELSLPKPSYTINTLQKLSEMYPENTFSLIIGADNWAVFDQWKNYEDILKAYKVMVYPRPDYRLSIAPKMRNRVEALESPMMEISSTFIRENIAKGKNLKAFLPHNVWQYISKNSLYTIKK